MLSGIRVKTSGVSEMVWESWVTPPTRQSTTAKYGSEHHLEHLELNTPPENSCIQTLYTREQAI